MNDIFTILICTMSNQLVNIRPPKLIMVININDGATEGFHCFL